jgi:hypothetical protein
VSFPQPAREEFYPFAGITWQPRGLDLPWRKNFVPIPIGWNSRSSANGNAKSLLFAVMTASAPRRDDGASPLRNCGAEPMTFLQKARAIVTDIQFLICLVVLGAGVALLVLLH